MNLEDHPGGSTLEGRPYARIAAAAEEGSTDGGGALLRIAGNSHLARRHGPNKKAKTIARKVIQG